MSDLWDVGLVGGIGCILSSMSLWVHQELHLNCKIWESFLFDHTCRNQEEEYHLRERCVDDLELLFLKKDDHITPEQMIACCRRLMHDPRDLGVSVRGLKLRISQYYTLMQDGELIIPWNWKGPTSSWYHKFYSIFLGCGVIPELPNVFWQVPILPLNISFYCVLMIG